MADRPCCTGALRGAIDRRGACFLRRQPAGRPCARVPVRRAVGRLETGHVAAPRVQGWDAQGTAHRCRRLRVQPDQATRAGDRVRSLLTNGPRRTASATRVARGARQRGTLATAFPHLAASCHAARPPLGYPKAAWCGVCLALVASNIRAVVMAAWRSVQGAESLAQALSLASGAHDIAQPSHGMLMAIPADEWRVCSRMRPAEMVATLKEVAEQGRLTASRPRARGPKQPRPTREGTIKASHVSTATLRRDRKVHAATP